MLSDYYDRLTRHLRLARLVGFGGGSGRLTVHRRLRPDDATAPEEVVHARLGAALDLPDCPRGLDAGSGLGGTVLALHARFGGRWDGVTLSPGQCARATQAAARAGVAEACRFHVRSYDAPLTDLLPAGVDAIVAIESLAHSPDPARSVANLARVLRPGGTLAVVDDMPAEGLAQDDPDLAGFKAGWRCPVLADAAALHAAMAAAGLDPAGGEDLTQRVFRRGAAWREALVRLNRALARAAPRSPVLGALHGGLLLERLYARGLMQYRLLVARRR